LNTFKCNHLTPLHSKGLNNLRHQFICPSSRFEITFIVKWLSFCFTRWLHILVFCINRHMKY